ncbi:hypothetical protein [Roseomonas sp. CECT 9278]|uniref:hypothetical protein n=1 Tax=Roseomonas sp. CECT 9278 TaxID=2845823 RepID=UPI001E507ABD|nr:hypothetical protein [Roseomonas sp. CECT 9278]CAH0186939.1 hypothetical protein ROS9278_01586 [Roseomonas sp. CECT 9278]
MTARTAALLAIRALAPAPEGFGAATPVDHRGDASLVTLDIPFRPDGLAEAAFALRLVFGDAIDAHDDPRGILLLPGDIAPAGEDYAAIVAAAAPRGLWWQPPPDLPVPAPERHGPDQALYAAMEAALGVARATDLAIALEVALVNELARPGEGAGRAPAQAAIATVMGADFAAGFAEALAARVADEVARMAPPPIRLD